MQAAVLVGGLGRRLRPYTFSIPKPLLPVGDTPMLELIIRGLARAEIRELILATGYQAPLIEAFCGDGSRFGVEISYVHEDKPLGTAGPLSLLRDRLADDELLLVMNGDVVTGLDFGELVSFARAGRYDLTVAYSVHTHRSPFGVLDLDGDVITGIVEKPAFEYPISAGIYVARKEALELIPRDTQFSVPQLVQRMLDRGMRVGAFGIDAFWIGLEHLESFAEAIEQFGEAVGEGDGQLAGSGDSAHRNGG